LGLVQTTVGMIAGLTASIGLVVLLLSLEARVAARAGYPGATRPRWRRGAALLGALLLAVGCAATYADVWRSRRLLEWRDLTPLAWEVAALESKGALGYQHDTLVRRLRAGRVDSEHARRIAAALRKAPTIGEELPYAFERLVWTEADILAWSRESLPLLAQIESDPEDPCRLNLSFPTIDRFTPGAPPLECVLIEARCTNVNAGEISVAIDGPFTRSLSSGFGPHDLWSFEIPEGHHETPRIPLSITWQFTLRRWPDGLLAGLDMVDRNELKHISLQVQSTCDVVAQGRRRVAEAWRKGT
jgi:hypothetical protein